MELRLVIVLVIFGAGNCKVLDLTCDQIRNFVDGHNSRRFKIAKGEVEGQPPATNLKFMMWDNELAAKAAKWASNNKFAHNPDHTIDSNRFQTGENLFYISTTNKQAKLNIDDALDAWFGEHKAFKFGPLDPEDFSSPPQIGHYTQMVWANTKYLGCAVSKYGDDWLTYLVVCDYGPGRQDDPQDHLDHTLGITLDTGVYKMILCGNYLGSSPYKTADKGNGALICDDDCSDPYDGNC